MGKAKLKVKQRAEAVSQAIGVETSGRRIHAKTRKLVEYGGN